MSIVMVTHASASTIRPSLTSVLRHLGTDDEVVVIDNASADGTPELVEEIFAEAAASPAKNGKRPAHAPLERRLRLIRNPYNTGLSRAYNQGAQEAHGDFVAFIHSDVIVTKHWADRLVAHLDIPCAGAVGPIADHAPGLQAGAMYLPQERLLMARPWEDAEPEDGSGPEDVAVWAHTRHRDQRAESKLLHSSCVMVPRKVLEDVGGFDEDLPLGGEDLEYSWRLREAGYRLLVATDTFVSHRGEGSLMAVPPELSRYLFQMATNRLAEKLVKHYLDRGESPPGPRAIWDIDWFIPSQLRIGVAVVGNDASRAAATEKVLKEGAAFPIEVQCLAAAPAPLNDFYICDYDLFVVLEAGATLGPGWMSRIAAAGDGGGAGIIVPRFSHCRTPSPADTPLLSSACGLCRIEEEGAIDTLTGADRPLVFVLTRTALENLVPDYRKLKKTGGVAMVMDEGARDWREVAAGLMRQVLEAGMALAELRDLSNLPLDMPSKLE